MVPIPMVSGRLFLHLSTIGLCGFLSVGCLGKKKDTTVAVEEQVPPPAAYPDPPRYPDTSGSSSSHASNAPAPFPAASAPAPAAPTKPAFKLRQGEQLVEHKITLGETLSSIAQKYNTSYRRIQEANGMSNTKIIAGKTIQVPTSAPPNLKMNGSTAVEPASTPSSPYSRTGGRYGSVTSTAPSAPATTSTRSYPGTVSQSPVSSSPGVYPLTTTAPPVSSSPYPSTTTAPVPPANPGATSYHPSTAPQERTGVVSPPTPPTFPTPNFGGGNVQFSQ